MKKKYSVLRWVQVGAILGIAACAGYIIWWMWGSHAYGAKRQAAAETYLTEAVPSAEASAQVPVGSEASSAEEEPLSPEIQVDFQGLWAVSPDVVGWLQVAGLSQVDEPVVYRDDEYYLDHSWDGTESRYGAIFLEEANTGDFSDYHTILYGHNMKDSAMFGELSAYEDAAFFAENGGIITLYTPNGIRYYQIFAAEYVDPADPIVYTAGFTPGEEYTAFLQGLLSRRLYDTGVEVKSTDHVLTLSTCSYGDKTRFVVHARLINA